MIQFKQLSYWEKVTLLEQLDFVIVGAGIVGSAAALKLRKRYPTAKILILERSFLPLGASTKNAGFTCFGSVTELLDDLKNMPEDLVWKTVEKRYSGLKKLLERFTSNQLNYEACGSYDLLSDVSNYSKDQIQYLNEQVEQITHEKTCYSLVDGLDEKFNFSGLNYGFYNRLEGAIDTGKLLLATQTELAKNNIQTLFGIELLEFENQTNGVLIHTNHGDITCSKLIIAVNGLAEKILPGLGVKPARAQVLVTSPIPNLKPKSTFHYDGGYFYFRSIGNRILLGGGRNLDFEGETTYSLNQSELIQNRLEELLSKQILPKEQFSIDYRWSGTMGVGRDKAPIIRLIHPHVAVGVKLGGMGVALGSLVGEELAELF